MTDAPAFGAHGVAGMIAEIAFVQQDHCFGWHVFELVYEAAPLWQEIAGCLGKPDDAGAAWLRDSSSIR